MGCGLGLTVSARRERKESNTMETLEKITVTGHAIAYPADYWEALEEHYPNEEERERAQALGLDHFGRGERCFRCGFLCVGEEEGE